MKRYTFGALSTTTLLLASCGGGGGAETAMNLSLAASSPVFAQCFELRPGTHFEWTDLTQSLVVEEMFEGQLERGVSELDGGITTFTEYWKVANGFVSFPGVVQYDALGNHSHTRSSPGQRVPDNMTPGQTLQVTYVETIYGPRHGAPVTSNESYPLTFVGFETLTLGARSFNNTCRISVPDANNPANNRVMWFAPGFGVIQLEEQDAQGAPLPGTHIRLATIFAAP